MCVCLCLGISGCVCQFVGLQGDQSYCPPLEIQDADKLVRMQRLRIIVHLIRKKIAKFEGLRPLGLVFKDDFLNSAFGWKMPILSLFM